VTSDDELARRLQGAQASAQAGSDALLQLAAADTPAIRQGASEQEAFLPCFGSLEDWVVSVFCPTYVRRSTPSFRWCGEWWRHPEAISRLEALWRSWEALRLDPLLGMSTWYAGHLDHQLPILTGAAGPFADCDPTQHFPPEDNRLHHVAAPADWWPPASG
jgi:hypothetical protein